MGKKCYISPIHAIFQGKSDLNANHFRNFLTFDLTKHLYLLSDADKASNTACCA